MKYLPNSDGSPPDSWIERQLPEPPEDEPIVCPDCKGERWIWNFRFDTDVPCPTCRGLGTVYEEELE